MNKTIARDDRQLASTLPFRNRAAPANEVAGTIQPVVLEIRPR